MLPDDDFFFALQDGQSFEDDDSLDDDSLDDDSLDDTKLLFILLFANLYISTTTIIKTISLANGITTLNNIGIINGILYNIECSLI